MTAAAVTEVTASAVGGAYGGLKGLSLALLGVYLIEGLVTTGPVIRAATGRGRHRQAVAVATGNTAETSQPLGLQLTEQNKQDLQEAGIAALLLIAKGQPLPSRPDMDTEKHT